MVENGVEVVLPKELSKAQFGAAMSVLYAMMVSGPWDEVTIRRAGLHVAVSAGATAPEGFCHALVSAISTRVMTADGSRVLYGAPEGVTPFAHQLAGRLGLRVVERWNPAQGWSTVPTLYVLEQRPDWLLSSESVISLPEAIVELSRGGVR